MPGRLLVVDDDETNRKILSGRLEAEGHKVSVAENGLRALEVIQAEPFDLVLLDILMPEIDGYQVLERLKSGQTTRDIPVIVLSALEEIESAVKCIEMGAEDYLTKPFIKGRKIELTNLPFPLFFKEGNSSLWQREERRDFSKGL